ncbi:hypothetical protein [Methylotenera mobilis]|uniref:Lipoprotein n=1 Tax=Methylotenera mobilis (strain JLW8 / ATCC BAA-1282 / DSM 17540) TaxID=583345 RepID=C6WWQ6_METML|nr:hypothetical protein [Methylotenera mobilis]ACT48355.1 hypothetical protein Mmol_1449 [Methylotenera mobilis JLW8]
MKRITLPACLILLAITGCTNQAEAQGRQATTDIAQETPIVKSKDEKPCLTNFSNKLAACTGSNSQQKRFVLVRSVAIPENQ